MERKSDVVVIEVDGEYRVRPAVCIIDGNKEGRSFRIANLTDCIVKVILPHDLVQERGDKEFELTEGGGLRSGCRHEVTLNPDAGGAYSYEVTCHRDGHDRNWRSKGHRGAQKRFARGESDPVVVIDPPPN